MLNKRIWIPNSDQNLQLKILVASHCGAIRHRGVTATISVLLEQFYWKSMKRDAEQLVKGCLHCIATRTGSVIPRPLAHSLHGERPNEVVHLDYLYMGAGIDNKSYVLIIRDDLSSFVWLFATEAATSGEAVNALTTWISSFGSMKWFVTDQGSHFKNELINGLSSELRINHHFTTAYSPWSNGTVERICREVLRACRALCSEWKLAPQDWPSVVECVQSVLNHSPLKRLGLRDKNYPGVYRTPMEVFTGHIPTRPLLHALPLYSYRSIMSTDLSDVQRILDIEAMQNSFVAMHKDVKQNTDSSRQRQVDAHNRRTNVQPVNLQKGDFVLVQRATKKGHKLSLMWLGPRRIVDVKSELVYEVEDIIHGKREVVHARRLLLYRADMDGKPVDERLLRAAEHADTVYLYANSIQSIRSRDGHIEVQIEWGGLPEEMDMTWEPLLQVQEDMPQLLEAFLATPGNRKLKEKAAALCSSK